MKDFLHLICDYDSGDLAWSEITAALRKNLPAGIWWEKTTIQAFDTIATGFCVAQLGLAGPDMRPDGTFIFANTAPRKDRRTARRNNAGEGFVWGKLDSGIEILAVNSGHSLSFVRDHLVELRATRAPDRGSQFRSRDFFPQVVGQLARDDYSFLRAKLDPKKFVPEIPENVVAYVDRPFGNLKTTIRSDDALTSKLASGARVQVTINGTVRTATVASGSFNVKEGDLALAPGSSGHDRRFWELFKRGGSAHDEFNRPSPGMLVKVETD